LPDNPVFTTVYLLLKSVMICVTKSAKICGLFLF
jgi:hypothetical protein